MREKKGRGKKQQEEVEQKENEIPMTAATSQGGGLRRRKCQ